MPYSLTGFPNPRETGRLYMQPGQARNSHRNDDQADHAGGHHRSVSSEQNQPDE
jgi:hypothetical protein